MTRAQSELGNIKREAARRGVDFTRWTSGEKAAFVRRYLRLRARNHVPASAFQIASRTESGESTQGGN